MKQIIEAIIKNLSIGQHLVQNINETIFLDKTIAPYHSSIGEHMRHILDYIECLAEGIDHSRVDFTSRDRNFYQENNKDQCYFYFEEMIRKLKRLECESVNITFQMIENLGNGPISIEANLGVTLFYLNTHILHHYAIVGYILAQLEQEIPVGFGVNPPPIAVT